MILRLPARKTADVHQVPPLLLLSWELSMHPWFTKPSKSCMIRFDQAKTCLLISPLSSYQFTPLYRGYHKSLVSSVTRIPRCNKAHVLQKLRKWNQRKGRHVDAVFLEMFPWFNCGGRATDGGYLERIAFGNVHVDAVLVCSQFVKIFFSC